MTLHRDRFVDSNTVFFQEFTENFQSDLATPEPLTSPGQATGGGQIPGDVTFGLTAKSDKNGVKGNCTVIDRATNTLLKCLDATTYFQSGTSATFSGNATVNGTPTTYRIKVTDNGEPGAGLDTFTITTLSGYSATACSRRETSRSIPDASKEGRPSSGGRPFFGRKTWQVMPR